MENELNFTFTGGSYLYISDVVNGFSYSPKKNNSWEKESFFRSIMESVENEAYYERGYFFTDEPELAGIDDVVLYDLLPEMPIWNDIYTFLNETYYVRDITETVRDLMDSRTDVLDDFQHYIVTKACPFDTIQDHIEKVSIIFNEKEKAFLPVVKTDYKVKDLWNQYTLTDSYKKKTEHAQTYYEELKDKEEERDDR